jgi:hypothetical protein
MCISNLVSGFWFIAIFWLNLPNDDYHFFLLHLLMDDIHHFGYNQQKNPKKNTGKDTGFFFPNL